MADKREFAKIDVGWHQNRKWYQVRRVLQRLMPDAMRDAMRAAYADARILHLVSILYGSQQRTDGLFPVSVVKALAEAESEEAITALFEVGLWVNHPGGMAETRDFLEHQASAGERSKESEKMRKLAESRWSKDAHRTAPRTAVRSAQESRGEERREESLGRAAATPRTGARKGTPIPTPFPVTPEMVAWARENVPNLDHKAVTDRFADYWAGVAGPKGIKLDWVATWRNWLRREADDGGTGARLPHGRPTTGPLPTWATPGHPDYDASAAGALARS